MNGENFGGFAKEVANNLDLTVSTLRRWSIELEKAGYIFEKNNKEQRIYFERDYKALREIKSLLKTGRAFNECVNAVVARLQHEQLTLSVHEKQEVEVRLSQQELQDMLNEAALKAVEVFSEKMKNEIELRDRQLVEELKSSLKVAEEQQRQMLLESAAAIEERKKRWWKFW